MMERKRSVYNLSLKREIMEELDCRRGDNSAEELLNMLLGDGCDERPSWKFKLYKYNECPRSFLNRLNMIWVYPIFISSIPIQWLILGSVGVNRDSKIGSILNRLVRLN